MPPRTSLQCRVDLISILIPSNTKFAVWGSISLTHESKTPKRT